MKNSRQPAFIYTYAYNEDERYLCHLEMRSFFGIDTGTKILKSPVKIDPSRSPFMKGRLEILVDGDTVEDIIAQAPEFRFRGRNKQSYILKNK